MSTQIPLATEHLIHTYIQSLSHPEQKSHKGNNGKVMVIGGSSLFHGAVLWSAEMASHIVDMVHVASTKENNEIIKAIKIAWQSGIVVPQKDIPHYALEDDVILVGNGMMRSEVENSKLKIESREWQDILKVVDEGRFTRELVYYLITHFSEKQFIFDAGALQMMDKKWLGSLKKKALVTPHQKEFMTLFGVDVREMEIEGKISTVEQMAQENGCIILLKAIDDIISDGKKTVVVRGGNAGLTKGGTGDILAGLIAGLSAHSDPFMSAVIGSYLLKQTADRLFQIKGNWYSVADIITLLPQLYHSLLQQR